MTTSISFPADLPISQARDEIIEALHNHQVIIVAGETGSGKTTQLPKIALAMGRERIAHTQPRRIAARAVAERIAEELASDLGDDVGYQVRFTDRVSDRTRIRIMTDGILLNQIHSDRLLRRYDTIIIDEAHERSLNIDFLLGYLKQLLPKRPDLKVIITSATIDPESFANHFADATGRPAPVITVSGRTYPVEIRYRPLVIEREVHDANTGASTIVREERDRFEALRDAVKELRREGPGDILVFLSGESEINDAADFLAGDADRAPGDRLEILPLYGRLSAADQYRVFASPPPGTRRVVLATNVAETSLTVPGITYVIDTGTARISRYSTRSKVQHLPIEPISQASAGQRAGRSGRLRPGVTIRLYSEEDFRSRPEYTDPEIRRTGLASVILQMMMLRLGTISEFPFLTPPDKRGINDGLTLLTELGAIHRGRITATGRAIARLPLEPRFARMLVESHRFGVTDEVRALVAGLTIQDVRERPEAERARADQLHARFVDPLGDLMTLLNLWNYLQEKHRELSSSAFRRLCRAEFLNYVRVREWMDLVRQLKRVERDLPARGRGQKIQAASTAEAVHRSVLAGLLSRLGVRDDTQPRVSPRGRDGGARRKPAQEYLGSRGTRFVLHPGSVLAQRPPEFVMSVELVETSRLFARVNAVIDPSWAEGVASHLTKRQVSEPRWEKSLGAAVATERVTLFGLPIVAGRRVPYDRIDAEHARELFIRHALVQGEWDSPQAFDRANWQLRREIEQLEDRTRRRDILASDDAIYAFFDERIPPEVTSTRRFEGWWKRAQRSSPKLLHLTRDILVEDEVQPPDDDQFPRVWSFGDQTLKLRYRFDPTAEDDGVSVTVPLPLLPRLEQADFSKLVPGLREELVTALIRSLPKTIRKHVVPASDWAKRLLDEIGPELDRPDGAALTELLARAIRRHTSMPVTTDDFDFDRLPKHLKPTFKVVDERGKTVGASKHVDDLKARFKDRVTTQVASVVQGQRRGRPSSLERRGLTTWDFDELPRVLDARYDSRGQGGIVRAYPAIIDRRKHVDLVVVSTQAEQERLTRKGIRRLLALSSPSPVSYIRDHLSNQEKLLLGAGPYRTLEDAISDVAVATAGRIIEDRHPDGLVWSRTEFEALANEYARTIIDDIFRGVSLVVTSLNRARLARQAIEGATNLQTLGQAKDTSAQLDALIYEGFVADAGLTQLARFPVYLQAIEMRTERLRTDPGRDRTLQLDVERVTEAYRVAGGSLPTKPDTPDRLVRIRWLIEELRVSLFAQQLGTAESVSTKRILRELNEYSSQ